MQAVAMEPDYVNRIARLCRSRWSLRIGMMVLIMSSFMSLLALLLYTTGLWYKLGHILSYGLRPIWDRKLIRDMESWEIIDNLGLITPNVSCPLHSFTVRKERTLPRVFDAFLFNNEIDMLEVRLHELNEVVYKFIIIESPCTFMGAKKSLGFDEQRSEQRFERFKEKIHRVIVNDNCDKGEKSWAAEAAMRAVAVKESRAAGAKNGDLFLFSDIDELPRLNSIQLLQACNFGNRIHLALSAYRYSFDFRIWPEFVFRSTVSVIGSMSDASLQRRFTVLTQRSLGDAGWHCSWCFRHIEDIIAKMTAYSHSDRVRSPHLLQPDVIQKKLCSGEDIFEFMPEAHTFHSLISKSYPMKKHGVSDTPRWIVENPNHFRFLLPSGCIREPKPNSTKPRR